MESFGNRLRELRKDKAITQKEIAKILGVSTTCYAGYEQGYREPDFKILKKLCVIFDVTADFLIGLEDETGTKYNNSFNNFNFNGRDMNIK